MMNRKLHKKMILKAGVRRRFTFGMKTKEKILNLIHKSKNNDMYHRNSFTKRIPPLIRFIEEHPAKYNTSSKQYLEGKTTI